MKQVHASYTFVASTKTITLTGLNIDQDQLLLIVNATRGVQYFNFADSSLRGVVTSGANTTVVLTDASTTGHSNSDALVIYYDDQVASQSVTGTVTANPGTGAFTVSGTVGLDPASLSALENVTVTVGAAVTVANFPAVQQVSGTVTANVDGVQIDNGIPFFNVGYFVSPGGSSIQVSDDVGTGLPVRVQEPISGTVTVGNSVTIGALPVQLSTTTIGGTARLNVTLSSAATLGATVPSYGNLYGGSDGTNFRAINVDSSGRTVVTGSISVSNLPSTQTVAGTVTANISSLPASTVTVSSLPNIAGTVTANISGTVPVSGTFWQATQPVSLASLPSSTVTVGAMPSGALTTRFGSVTTANTAQLTAAVTNSSRKFLLVQNIATSTVTIGIGFAPTTTQGIQLAAGAGLTFDAFCPTGGVWWLSSAAGSNWSILEG